MERATSFGKILARKALHSLGAFILAIQVLFGLEIAQLVILTMLILYAISEVLRLSGKSLPLFAYITHIGSTEEERRGIVSTPIWFALGILTTISLFPIEYAMIGVLTLTMGDPVASLVGQSIKNRHHYPFNRSKSVEGTLAGFSTALIACSLLGDPVISLIGCLGGMLIEALPIPINDNLTIPLISALTSMMAGVLLG